MVSEKDKILINIYPDSSRKKKISIQTLGSQNREKESKMVVAKRQRKGKAQENGTKENPQTEVRTSGEANTPPSWLVITCIGQAQGYSNPKR